MVSTNIQSIKQTNKKKIKHKGSERLILIGKQFCLKHFLKVNENML